MELSTSVEIDEAKSVAKLSLAGALNTDTAPGFESRLQEVIGEGLQLTVLDMKELDYISSAGLRVIFKAAKEVKSTGRRLAAAENLAAAGVATAQIARTCGACHEDIKAGFEDSIHGTALADGNSDSPTCTDCHNEHSILPHDDPDSRVSAANLSGAVCNPCHANYELSRKYGSKGSPTLSRCRRATASIVWIWAS